MDRTAVIIMGSESDMGQPGTSRSALSRLDFDAKTPCRSAHKQPLEVLRLIRNL
jgi:phosphoribosylcarboxyaminoimidazole (NCAIR) mutase